VVIPGHEYGTGLADEERWALVEYLETLLGEPGKRTIARVLPGRQFGRGKPAPGAAAVAAALPLC
jgi:hypothetical protein